MLQSACEIRRRDAGREESDVVAEAVETEEVREEPERLPSSDPDDDRSLEEHLRDASIAARVKLALADQDELRALDVEAEVRRGVVVLQGQAPSVRHYAMAEQIARGVSGVRGVQNAIDAPGVEELPPSSPESLEAPSEAPTTKEGELPSASLGDPATTDTQPGTPTAVEAEPTAEYHVVTSGESLWEIARENNTSVEALKRLNNLQGDRLQPGQRLRTR